MLPMSLESFHTAWNSIIMKRFTELEIQLKLIAQGGIEGSEEAYDDEHGFDYSGLDVLE